MNRCSHPINIPRQHEVKPSKPPPPAKNKQYQQLAEAAEKLVPSIWWRDGFAYDGFLLSHNDSELPRKLFDSSIFKKQATQEHLDLRDSTSFHQKII